MSELGTAFKQILDKLVEFFDIFDLSFIISGVATAVSIWFWLFQRNFIPYFDIKPSYLIFLVIISFYVAGLISFSFGRWIRMGLFWHEYSRKKQQNDIISILKSHKLYLKPNIKQYLLDSEDKEIEHGAWRLYIRFWALIRKDTHFANSKTLLNRYWVMSATFDGLIFTTVSIFILVQDAFWGCLGTSLIPSLKVYIFVCVVLIAIFLIFLHEAKRYVDYQCEELIATIAASEDYLKQNDSFFN